jgi:hypothetical protein
MIEELRKEFISLEKEHYYIINNYITSKVSKEEYKNFTVKLFKFREKLDNYKPKTEEIYEVAGMKSRVQHYITDTVEDEEILKSLFS